MRKFIFAFASFFALFPFIAFGAFDRDLYFGVTGEDVAALQQFLTDQGVYSGPLNGNFFSLTRSGVKRFQEREGISPAAGYFGPVTRARASSMIVAVSREEQIAALKAKIVMLTAQLAELTPRLIPSPSATPSLVPSETPLPLPSVSASPSPSSSPSPVPALEISGSQETKFPDTETTWLKAGNIKIRNGTASSVTFAQIELDVYDAMNSPVNRNHVVYFVLRDGIEEIDPLISETKFTFNQKDPPTGEMYNRRQVNLGFPMTLKAGEEKSFGLWIENLRYVIGGYLEIKPFNFQIINGVATGGFRFLLTR